MHLANLKLSKIRGKMEKLQISDPTIISSCSFLPVYPMSTPFKCGISASVEDGGAVQNRHVS